MGLPSLGCPSSITRRQCRRLLLSDRFHQSSLEACNALNDSPHRPLVGFDHSKVLLIPAPKTVVPLSIQFFFLCLPQMQWVPPLHPTPFLTQTSKSIRLR